MIFHLASIPNDKMLISKRVNYAQASINHWTTNGRITIIIIDERLVFNLFFADLDNNGTAAIKFVSVLFDFSSVIISTFE